MRLAVDDEIELLQPPVAADVAEVDHPDVVFLDEADDVLLGKIVGGLAQIPDDLVRIQRNGLVHAVSS